MDSDIEGNDSSLSNSDIIGNNIIPYIDYIAEINYKIYNDDVSLKNIRDALEKQLDLLKSEYSEIFGEEAANNAFARRASAGSDGVLDPGMGVRDQARDTAAEITAPQSATATKSKEDIAKAIAQMSINERKKFLDSYYSKREKWNPGRGKRIPLQAFLNWLDKQFHDRRELGLLLSDLKDLDRKAYQKIIDEGGARSDVPASLGFPSKMEPYDPEAAVPTGAEVFDAFRRGDPSAKDLNRRRTTASYHIKKPDKAGP